MRTYIRDRTDGATYFFTLNLLNRQSELLIQHINELRIAYRKTQHTMPFTLDAMVVLPEHLHMLMTLPEGDQDYPKRISCLKGLFSRQIPRSESVNESRTHKGERGIWQRRYWEHRIRDALDFQRHVDYIHYNPVKHGHAQQVRDWQYSTFHRYVREGFYSIDWASEICMEFDGIGSADV
jgi:putative transposase